MIDTELSARIDMAASVGFIDSRFMVYMKETHGYPLSLCAIHAAKYGLRVDFRGLRWELERIGKNPDTIESELKEVRFFLSSLHPNEVST